MSELRPVTPLSILSKKLSELKDLGSKMGLEGELSKLIEECCALAQPLDQYLAEHSTKASPALIALEKHTNALDWEAAFQKGATSIRLEKEMLSGALEGQLLQMLVALTGAKHILEIGSFTSYASLAMAEALPEEGTLIACEYDPFAADFAQQQLANTPVGKKVKIQVGEALATLSALQKEGYSFDFVFLDADKENYLIYYQTILEADLLKVGGLLCVDNTLYMGQVYGAGEQTKNGAAIEAFNKAVKADPNVQKVILPIRDGLTLIRRIA
ncbi:MAG: class I SAM-dependent methyltransferase [Bacteroidota bacterium]